jgi:hypothetical protein
MNYRKNDEIIIRKIYEYEMSALATMAISCLCAMRNHMGLPTISWFKTLTWSDIRNTKNCGPKTVAFLKRFCEHENITLEP